MPPERFVVFTVSLWGCLGLVLLGAAVSDYRTRRIPNLLVLLGLIMALVWHVVVPEGQWAFDRRNPGSTGVLGSAAAALVMLGAFFPLWLARLLGAGDVKLLTVVGAFFGVRAEQWIQLPSVVLWILVAGGVLSLLRLRSWWRIYMAFQNVSRLLFATWLRAPGTAAQSFDSRKDGVGNLPYAVAIAVGTLSYLVFQTRESWF